MRRKRWTTSKVIAVGILLVDGAATMAVLALCGLAILRDFTGALPYLTTLIGALQAAAGTLFQEVCPGEHERRHRLRRRPWCVRF